MSPTSSPPATRSSCAPASPARPRSRRDLRRPPSASWSRVAVHDRRAAGPVPHRVRARPGPDPPLQGLPAPEAQDPGVHRPRGGPLRHAPHAHPPGDADRPVPGRRAVAQRGLAEAIALGHDVGHSPFGHTGEDALSPYFPTTGGWHHAAQSVRIFEVLEDLNLTWEVRDGIRAHSWRIDPPPATQEAMCVRYADRIAYLTHDALDADACRAAHRRGLPGRPSAHDSAPSAATGSGA